MKAQPHVGDVRAERAACGGFTTFAVLLDVAREIVRRHDGDVHSALAATR